jgi:ribosomal protein S18 acetylase RimI-like enzyme
MALTSAHTAVREYTSDDLSEIRRCIVELEEFERQIDPRLKPGESMADGYLEDTLRRCRERAGTIFVAEVAGQIAGFVTILTRVPFEGLDEPEGDHALIADLLVSAKFRGRGLGEALLRAGEQYAAAGGAMELRVNVLSGNDPAESLYRRRGFTPYLSTLTKRLDA